MFWYWKTKPLIMKMISTTLSLPSLKFTPHIAVVHLQAVDSKKTSFSSLSSNSSSSPRPSLVFALSSSSSTCTCMSMSSHPLFAAIISCIFSSSSLTWWLSPLALLLKTWYLCPHLSTSHCRAIPSYSMCCSMALSPSRSPKVNRTILWSQTVAPKSLKWSSIAFRSCSLKEQSTRTTKMKATGPEVDRDTLCVISSLFSSGVCSMGRCFHQPGVSMMLTCCPPTSPCLWTHRAVLLDPNTCWPRIVFPVELFPASP